MGDQRKLLQELDEKAVFDPEFSSDLTKTIVSSSLVPDFG
jgi:hypothetical protein